jgi:hypothetical protein
VLDYCWTIVAAETLVAAYAIKNTNRDLKDLLFQELLDYFCSNLDRDYKHFYDAALMHIYEKGIRVTKSYPLTGRKGKCEPKIGNEVIRNNFFYLQIYLFFCSFRKLMHSGGATFR